MRLYYSVFIEDGERDKNEVYYETPHEIWVPKYVYQLYCLRVCVIKAGLFSPDAYMLYICKVCTTCVHYLSRTLRKSVFEACTNCKDPDRSEKLYSLIREFELKVVILRITQ